MTDEERAKRLNAAFDAMSEGLSEDELADMTSAMTGVKTVDDVLRYRDQIAALGRENRVMSLNVFEADPADRLPGADSQLCMLVIGDNDFRIWHRIRFGQGLRQLLGCAPYLIDAEAFDHFDRSIHEEEAVEIWCPTDWHPSDWAD